MLLNLKNSLRLFSVLLAITLVTGCSIAPAPLATPEEMATLNITPIDGNSGKFMSPITSDGVPAEWVDNAINAKMGAGIGSAVGALAGQKLLENVPFIGGFLGEKVGNAAGRAIAIKAAGGEEFIRESSDLSFNNLNDLSVYLYATYGNNENYKDVLSAASEIYTDLKKTNYQALRLASNKVKENAKYTTNAK